MRIEERKLPEFMAYVNAQLTGRPLHTLLWFIWVMIVSAILMAKIPAVGGHIPTIEPAIEVVSIIGAACSLIILITTLFRKSGRRWLMTVSQDKPDTPQSGRFKMAIRLIPLLGLAAVILFLSLS
jgi:hypothetical protein